MRKNKYEFDKIPWKQEITPRGETPLRKLQEEQAPKPKKKGNIIIGAAVGIAFSVLVGLSGPGPKPLTEEQRITLEMFDEHYAWSHGGIKPADQKWTDEVRDEVNREYAEFCRDEGVQAEVAERLRAARERDEVAK